MDWKQKAKDLLPPPILRGLRALRGGEGTRFEGPFDSWEAAAAAAGGYDDTAILDQVRESARAVRRGEAAFERDSVRFAEFEPWPHAGVLARLAVDGRLHVLDFGGSLGSTFHQCRPDLGAVRTLRWSVVEQPAFVRAGREEFETPELRFFESIEEAAAASPPDVVLLSSVLQYLPDPSAIAARLGALEARAILIDRTPVSDGGEERIVVQHVAPAIYRASYPFRIFPRARLAGLFGPRWRESAELTGTSFPALEDLGAGYAALLLERT